MTSRPPAEVSLHAVMPTVYNRESMDRDGPPFDTQYQETLQGSLELPGGLQHGDPALKASLKAALFHQVQEPTRIGRFALIERIGAGAMGEVYAAYDEQLDRKVAIKLVRPDRLAPAGEGAAGSMDSRRLLREAQVLAQLSHPNVVQVYEAGLFGDRVFVAMEFIRGQTLRQWLVTHGQVSEPERWRRVIEMFMAAGRGLQAAHAAGLVHRDFKPDNVLVGSEGRVCVADFGLARATQSGSVAGEALEAATIEQHVATSSDVQSPLHSLTETGTILGTPGYMSPEQMKGEPSDSRADQFSFCVALYEALYRVRPFVARSLAELRQLVTSGAHAEPPRDTEVPARIRNVLARGLAAEPAARYPSMGELLVALAHDPALTWRRYLVAALLLGAGALGGAVVFSADSAVAADPCALAGSATARLWSPEVAERVHAAFLATNLAYAGAAWDLVRTRMDEYAGSLAAERKATCEATHVRHEQPEDLFRLKTLCLDGRERHLEALLAELGQADAGTVEHSARMAADLPRIEVCRDGEALVLGLQPPDDAKIAAEVREIRNRLATVRVQHAAGHYPQALRLAEETLAATEAVAYPPVRAEALHLLGLALRDGATAANVARAEQTLLEALDVAESHRNDELVNEIWLDLVRLAKRHHQDLTLAQQWARRALATSNRISDGGQQRSLALGHLGSLHYREGKYALAEREQREALALAEQSHASRLALSDRWQALANALEAQERSSETRDAYERALDLRQTDLGDRHPHVARLSYDFGTFLRNAGELARARALLTQALQIWTEVYGPRSIDGADAHLALVLVELDAGELDRAEAHAWQAHDILGVVAADSPARGRAEVRLGLVAFRQQRFRDALAAFERGLSIQRQTGASPQSIGRTLNSIAESLVELGRLDEALAAAGEAERALAGDKPLFRAMAHKVRGLALLGKGNARGAVQELEEARMLLESQEGDLLELADVQWALARALHAAGDAGDGRARALAERARQIYRDRGRAGTAPSEDITRWLDDRSRR
jgi:tetratricopeptide (TPR) repeat protein/tRNA A-37 threonylcarbamoyl transferase component Bud32